MPKFLKIHYFSNQTNNVYNIMYLVFIKTIKLLQTWIVYLQKPENECVIIFNYKSITIYSLENTFNL